MLTDELPLIRPEQPRPATPDAAQPASPRVLCCVAAACVSAYLLTFALAFALSTLI